MFTNRVIWRAISASVLATLSAQAQPGPNSGLYQIVSGDYIECCGFAGGIRRPLPNGNQSFVKLTVDPQSNLTSMMFLGADRQTVFSIIPCPPATPISFSFSHGLVFSNGIVFHVDPGPPPSQTFWNYTASNSPNGLRVDGLLGTAQGMCADVPTRFMHSNVVATLMPVTTIRVSEVEVCWNSALNTSYQVQYRPRAETNGWTNLGSSVPGNGATNCITDKVAQGQAQRLYRVLTLP